MSQGEPAMAPSNKTPKAALVTRPLEVDPAIVELVGQIAAGDTAAEARLVELHQRGLRYMLLRLTGDPSTTDDLFQETFRIVLEKLRSGKLREPEKLAGFVRGIARNLWLAANRKQRRRGEGEGLDEAGPLPDPTPSSEQRIQLREDRQRVHDLLAELKSARDREVLFRFYIAEEPRNTICAELGLEEKQLAVVLFRARQRFRQLVETSETEIPGPLGTPSHERPENPRAARGNPS